MLNAQTFATYSFGLVYETSYISEPFPNNSKRLLYFHKNLHRHPPLRAISAMFGYKVTNK